ncbi:MOXD1 1-like 1 [Homarus americanus]|uniref:MOXD1 1-like 1 n=1 Tax=Homarus americanus TaxID=6706 RepID=A0A8J5T3T8_HOMAM|nr:MOXD1 1-like 1 [Homarus americanus]
MLSWVWSVWVVLCGVGVGMGVWAEPAEDLPSIPLQHRVVLDQEGAYYLLWTPREKDVVFEVQVATLGYVGLGFSPNGGMKGADILLGWVDLQGQIYLHDRHGEGNWRPPVDDTQDVEVLGGYQNDTHTVLRFSRPWYTCDDKHDLPLSENTIRIIWCYGLEDPRDAESVRIHHQRGTKSLYLKEPRFSLPTFSDDVTTWDIRSSNISIPGDISTLYWCKLFKFPPLTHKTHMIGYEPIIEARNMQYVHHMLLYGCHLEDAPTHYEKWLQVDGSQCYSSNMPTSWRYCKAPLITWAIGSEGEVFPDHVGFPLGEDHGGADYFMLEIHYDNPSLKQGIVDGSGLRLYHTQKLRQYDAAVLTVGHYVTPELIIPPGQHWETIGLCSDDCTRQGLPEGGVKVFQAVLHTHLLGSDISLKHIREGRELPTKIKEMTILPGDALITQCGYDSTAKIKPVFGGFSSAEEMCFVFLSYYPRVDLTDCTSRPQLLKLLNTLGVNELYYGLDHILNFGPKTVNKESEKVEEYNPSFKKIYLNRAFDRLFVKSPEAIRNTSVSTILDNDATWRNKTQLTSFQEEVIYGTHTAKCEMKNGHNLQGVSNITKYPEFVAIQQVSPPCSPLQNSSRGVLQGQGDRKPEAYTIDSLSPRFQVFIESVTSQDPLTAHNTSMGVESENQGAGAGQATLCSTVSMVCLFIYSLQ